MGDVFNLHVCWARKLAWCRMVKPEVDCETCMIETIRKAFILTYITNEIVLFLFVTRIKV